jgi:hypothetical protein
LKILFVEDRENHQLKLDARRSLAAGGSFGMRFIQY